MNLKECLDKIFAQKKEYLTPENIKTGIQVFDIEGTFTNDGTATKEDIVKDKIAYVNGEKIVGTMNVSKYNASTITTLGAGNSSTSSLNRSIEEISGTFDIASEYTQYMFWYCQKLKRIPQINTDIMRYMNCMFYFCQSLVEIPELNASNVINVNSSFYRCDELTDFGGLKNLGKTYIGTTTNNSNYKLDLSHSKKLTHESLMNVINNLYDLNITCKVESGGTLYSQTLSLGSANLAKLTDEEIAIATNKGWNVS